VVAIFVEERITTRMIAPKTPSIRLTISVGIWRMSSTLVIEYLFLYFVDNINFKEIKY